MRPQSFRYVTSPLWVTLFERYDPGSTGLPAELRHPFFDVRLASFLLQLPPVPWCVDKAILRTAMAGRLPEAVIRRPKSPLSGFPAYESLKRFHPANMEKIRNVPLLENYIQIDPFLQVAQKPEKLRPGEHALITRPLGLAVWLDQVQSAGETAHWR
jgi:asparagine synthase (glutamine-hydrolysing)